MKTYLQVTIQNHWTVPLNHPYPFFNFLPSQERYLFTQCRRLLEKFCATNSVKKNTCRMAVGWTEPRMVFEISLQAMTHQRRLEEVQADSFANNWSRSYLQRVKVSG